jgi:hypothetical protein
MKIATVIKEDGEAQSLKLEETSQSGSTCFLFQRIEDEGIRKLNPITISFLIKDNKQGSEEEERFNAFVFLIRDDVVLLRDFINDVLENLN